MLKENLNIVIYGTGAIGATIGGWLTKDYKNIYFLARGENFKVLKTSGLTLYKIDKKNFEAIPVNVIEDLKELESVDIIIICVKNYDLENVAKDIYEKVGDNVVIVGLQNGVKNQKILPKYFSKVIYGVIVMSSWRDKPGVFGTRGKNQIILGTLNENNQEILEDITTIFNKSFPTILTHDFQDAIHCKLIINLGNSMFTLIDQKIQDDESILKLWKILMNLYLEGVNIVKAAGYKEYKLKGLPTWEFMKLALKSNKKTLINNFKASIKFYWLNSMTQDILLGQKSISELESINGYLINLADRHGLSVPYNRTIYKLCKVNFSKTPYKPLNVDTVCNEIKNNLKLS